MLIDDGEGEAYDICPNDGKIGYWYALADELSASGTYGQMRENGVIRVYGSGYDEWVLLGAIVADCSLFNPHTGDCEPYLSADFPQNADEEDGFFRDYHACLQTCTPWLWHPCMPRSWRPDGCPCSGGNQCDGMCLAFGVDDANECAALEEGACGWLPQTGYHCRIYGGVVGVNAVISLDSSEPPDLRCRTVTDRPGGCPCNHDGQCEDICVAGVPGGTRGEPCATAGTCGTGWGLSGCWCILDGEREGTVDCYFGLP